MLPLLLTTLLLSSVPQQDSVPGAPAASDWSRFRGPNGDGVAAVTGLPVRFGPEQNRAWRTPLDPGRSSPVFGAGALFLTSSTDAALQVHALDPGTGAIRWTRELERAHREEIYSANDSAAPSPVTDGERVIVFFAELGLVCFSVEGEELWRHPLGPFVSFYGMASSPLLVDETVYLQCDQQQGSFLLAVDAASGEQRWRVEREGLIESWATPVLHPADAPTTLVTAGSYFVCGYDLATGAETWRVGGLGYAPAGSPLVHGDLVLALAPQHAEQPMPPFGGLLADRDSDGDGALSREESEGIWVAEHFGWIDADRSDDITAAEWTFVSDGMSHRSYGLIAIELTGGEDGPAEVWRYRRSLPKVSSPVLYEGLVYLARAGGVLTSVDLATGEATKSERIGKGAAEVHASPVAADGKLFVSNNAGEVVVVRAGPSWEVLAVNDLDEELEASPALYGDALYVRTSEALWCFRDLDTAESGGD